MAKLSDLINCNYDDSKLRTLLQDKLLDLPFFAKYDDMSDVKFESLEAAMRKLSMKYPVQIGYILNNVSNDPPFYSFMLKETENHSCILTIYARSLREGFEKSILYSYHYCKKHFMEDN